MATPHRFLYLSRADVEAVGLPMRAVIDAVDAAFREKAAGGTIMPPKHWVAPSARFGGVAVAIHRYALAT